MNTEDFQKKILILGGAGFIGSHFAKMCVDKGLEVCVLDKLTYAGSLENLKTVANDIRFEENDICDRQAVTQVLQGFEPHFIVNFAAESHVDRSIASAADFMETNIQGTYNLLCCALKYYEQLSSADQKTFRFLQVSTDEVYGELGPKGSFSEETPYAPNSPYSASKAAGDFLGRAWWKTHKLPVITTHCSNNYGPHQYPEKLIPTIIKNALSLSNVPIYGTGENIRDWIFVEDHCRGIWLSLIKGKPGEVYCFGGANEVSNINIAKKILTTLDEASPRKDLESHLNLITFVEDRKGHDFRYAIDFSKASRELGYFPQKSFENGMKETLDWYINYFRDNPQEDS